jgi:putative transposase
VPQPREIHAGRTYLVTRRTLRRHHLLRPDGKMRQIFLYCLAVCAQKHASRCTCLRRDSEG